MRIVLLRLPDSLHRQVKEPAARDGISIHPFVATAVAEKMSALVTEEYLRERAARGSRAKYEAALAQAPDVEPHDRDRILTRAHPGPRSTAIPEHRYGRFVSSMAPADGAARRSQ